MSNKAYTDFFKTKLNEVVGSDAIFGGGHLWSYINGELSCNIPNQETLQIDKKDLIPFTVVAFDGERVALSTKSIFKRTMPLVFTVRYAKRVEYEAYIEAFASSLNGKTFNVNGVSTGFSCGIVSSLTGGIELKAQDWLTITLTVFAYEGNVMIGNGVVFSINGTVIEPLSYNTSMQNEMNYKTPALQNYGRNKSNGKNHNRKFVLFQDLTDDTWVKEIEGDTLNTLYTVSVTYPFETPYVASRTMRCSTGHAQIQNGTAILLEMVFVDG